MKKTSKLFSVLLAVVLVFAMAVPAFAAGDDGKIIINNAIENQNYTIYKMLDYVPTTGDADKGIYTIESGWEAFFSGAVAQNYFAVADNKVTMKSDDTDVDAILANAAIEYAKTTAGVVAKETKKAEGATVEFTGLDFGYYAVDTSLGTICALTNTDTEAKAYEKNAVPALVKKILEGGTPVDANNVAIGDTVNYQVTISAKPGAENYVMHDDLSDGLTLDPDSIAIAGLTKDTDYTVKTAGFDDDCDFEIAFKKAYLDKITSDTDIVVTYSAKLDSDAIVGTEGNPNTAWLEYGNVIDTDGDGDVDEDDEKPETPKDIVITYTAKLIVYKVDGDNNALTGAGFTLYKGETKIGDELKTGSEFVWTGLKEGTYTLKETTTPDGYNTAADITFTITCNEPDEVEKTDDLAEWKSNNEKVAFNGTVSAFEATVQNLTGKTLPETGGIGTTIFYIVGGLLVVGAAILLITKKRMSAEA